MNFRPYRASDVATLFNIDQQCFPPGIAYSMEELAAYIAHEGSRTWVAEEDKQVAGFLVASRQPDKSGHIITIDVPEQWRRRGVGRSLMQLAERWAGNSGIATMWLETAVDNVVAQGFYESLGYLKTCKIKNYYGHGRDAWIMMKRVKC